MWEKGASSGEDVGKTAWAESVPRRLPRTGRSGAARAAKAERSQPDKGFIVYSRGAPSPAPDRWLPRRRHGAGHQDLIGRFAIRDDGACLVTRNASPATSTHIGWSAGRRRRRARCRGRHQPLLFRRVVQVGAKEGRLLGVMDDAGDLDFVASQRSSRRTRNIGRASRKSCDLDDVEPHAAEFFGTYALSRRARRRRRSTLSGNARRGPRRRRERQARPCRSHGLLDQLIEIGINVRFKSYHGSHAKKRG